MVWGEWSMEEAGPTHSAATIPSFILPIFVIMAILSSWRCSQTHWASQKSEKDVWRGWLREKLCVWRRFLWDHSDPERWGCTFSRVSFLYKHWYGGTTCSYVFRQRFFRVNFFHPSPVAGPRGGDPFHPRGWSFVQHGKNNIFFCGK